MSKTLEEAENTSVKIVKLLEGLPDDILSSKEKENARARVMNVQDLLTASKRKMVMRTPKGEELAQMARVDASRMEGLLSVLSEKSGVGSVLEQLTKLEADADKIGTYWRSYEAVLT